MTGRRPRPQPPSPGFFRCFASQNRSYSSKVTGYRPIAKRRPIATRCCGRSSRTPFLAIRGSHLEFAHRITTNSSANSRSRNTARSDLSASPPGLAVRDVGRPDAGVESTLEGSNSGPVGLSAAVAGLPAGRVALARPVDGATSSRAPLVAGLVARRSGHNGWRGDPEYGPPSHGYRRGGMKSRSLALGSRQDGRADANTPTTRLETWRIRPRCAALSLPRRDALAKEFCTPERRGQFHVSAGVPRFDRERCMYMD